MLANSASTFFFLFFFFQITCLWTVYTTQTCYLIKTACGAEACNAFLTLLPSVISTSLKPLPCVSPPWYSDALANKHANSLSWFPTPTFVAIVHTQPTPHADSNKWGSFYFIIILHWKSNRQLSPTVLPFTYCSSFISRWLMFIFLQNKNKNKTKKKEEFRHSLYTPNPNHTPPFNPSRTNTLTWEPNF